MSWYYNQATGQIFEAAGTQKWVLDREIDREKLAAKVGVPQMFHGPFATQAQARNFAAVNPTYVDQARQLNPVTDVREAILHAVTTVRKMEIRLIEAAVGIVLLAVAANAILKQTTGVDAAGTAVRAGKTAGKAGAKVAATAALL